MSNTLYASRPRNIAELERVIYYGTFKKKDSYEMLKKMQEALYFFTSNSMYEGE